MCSRLQYTWQVVTIKFVAEVCIMRTMTAVPTVMRRYKVTYSLRGYPSRVAETVVTAPSMQYIKNNWYAICGGQPFILKKINALV